MFGTYQDIIFRNFADITPHRQGVNEQFKLHTLTHIRPGKHHQDQGTYEEVSLDSFSKVLDVLLFQVLSTQHLVLDRLCCGQRLSVSCMLKVGVER